MSEEFYPWGDQRRFNSYSNYFRRTFGDRVQKLSVNAGFTCPNRDGTVAVGGCTFCNNGAFSPSYCESHKSVAQQLEEGIEFHIKRYRRADKYLAYFQSFSNTHAPLEELKKIYSQAFEVDRVIGIIVGTRPDCVDEQKLDYFAELAKDHYVVIEYGVESCYDESLKAINRGHDFAKSRWAIEQTAQRGINVGAHFILGLPTETRQMMIDQVQTINSLPLTTIKFHQLQIFKDTAMETQYQSAPDDFSFFERDEYIDFFIEILRRLDPRIVMERFASEAPPRFHAGPTWGLVRNEQLLSIFENRLEELGVSQGDLFK